MKKILVIEDEELVRQNILEILETVEFEAIGAENGQIGIQLAQEREPDLILCDVMMPEIDGYGVLSTLRKNMKTARIPFIFLTAKGDKTDIREGMNQGADDYLTKPFRRKDLLEAIEARLAKHESLYQGYAKEQTELVASLQQVEAQLQDTMYYDRLTKLPNQLLLREQFDRLRERADRNGDAIALVSIGLDRFKRINKTLGSLYGDRLLQKVATRLSQYVGEEDMVARLHTDQFAIIFAPTPQESPGEDRENGAIATAIAQPLLDTLTEPFRLDDREIFITASIGISIYPQDGDDVDRLMKNTTVAMSYAKQLGGNQFQCYSPTLESESVEDLSLETSLRYALERKEFQVYYQPIVTLETGTIVGAEALVRWYHPQLGSISPAKFIPLAEQTGLIAPLGEWVLHTACQQIKQWQNQGLPWVRVAVNLSFRQFNQPDLSQRLAHILEATQLDPIWLEIELTESIIVQNVEATIAKINNLKDLGIKVSLDDFGTGYSSLSYLQQFPFDVLKIDRCFVQEIHKNATNAALTSAIIQMAHSLNLKVIAEGVEEYEELEVLYKNKCDKVQGYFFSRPVNADEFQKMLKMGKRWEVKSISSRPSSK